jgi:hypothetical protein
LKPNIGTIYLSCSGVSDDINKSYAQLYRRDAAATREEYTYYYSRCDRDDDDNDSSNGDRILYTMHHCTVPEFEDLLGDAGLEEIHMYIKRKKPAVGDRTRLPTLCTRPQERKNNDAKNFK